MTLNNERTPAPPVMTNDLEAYRNYSLRSNAGDPTRAGIPAGRASDRKDRLLITGWYAIANLDYAGAIAAMRAIIASYPAERDAYLRLGLLLRGVDRTDEAIEICCCGCRRG